MRTAAAVSPTRLVVAVSALLTVGAASPAAARVPPSAMSPAPTTTDAAPAAPAAPAAAPAAADTPAPATATTELPAVGGTDTGAPAADAAAAGEAKLVAILDLVAADKDAAPLANAMAAVIASDVATRPGHRAVSRNELKAILSQKADAAMLGCDSAACAADVAKLVDAQLVITGGLERITGSEAGPGGVAHVVTLSLIEPTAPAIIARTEATWRGSPEEMVTLIRPLLDKLFGGAAASSFTGSLEVLAVDGAKVFVDGAERGTTPLKTALKDLPIGVHTLELARDGYEPDRRDVVISKNETTVAHVEMIELPITSQWWFWASVGGGAAVLIAAGATIGTAAILEGLEPPPTTLNVKTPLPSTSGAAQ